jgi:uncharacterized protein
MPVPEKKQEERRTLPIVLDSPGISCVEVTVREAIMKEYRVSLADLPEQGADFVLEDARLWEAPAAEFRLNCRMPRSLRAVVRVEPLKNGFRVRGRLTGVLYMPCSRCAEEAELRLDESFEQVPVFRSFENADDGEEDAPDFEEERHLRMADGAAPELDLAALCVEEFILALPVKALCRPDCKGLCPECGVNRNVTACACGERKGDPRLVVLRNVRIPS